MDYRGLRVRCRRLGGMAAAMQWDPYETNKALSQLSRPTLRATIGSVQMIAAAMYSLVFCMVFATALSFAIADLVFFLLCSV